MSTASPPPLPALPARPRDGHKGTFGHVLCLAGSAAYPGAAVLCARAALRGGAGLVTLAHPRSIHVTAAAQLVCEIALALDEVDGAFAAWGAAEAVRLADERDAVALGPGISREPEAAAFARAVGIEAVRPTVIDADGLNAFEGHAADLREARGPRILTPHPGEAARLLGSSAADVRSDPAAAALELAARTAAVVVLKGAPTHVTDGVRTRRNTTGNPGLATGGTGDVLTGLVAALLAQGLAPFDAAALGAHLHGLAGDLAAARLGEHGMIATDVLDHLPAAFVEHARTG